MQPFALMDEVNSIFKYIVTKLAFLQLIQELLISVNQFVQEQNVKINSFSFLNTNKEHDNDNICRDCHTNCIAGKCIKGSYNNNNYD